MSERPTMRRGPIGWLAERSWPWWLAVSVWGPLLYALSTGPILRIREELRTAAIISRGADATLHPAIEASVTWYVEPLNFLGQHSPQLIASAIWSYWYVCWTVPLPFSDE